MSKNIVSAEVLSRLGASPSHVRNICVLAHVDHGKTTLTDGLLASNGIISAKLAGKVRYMDSTEEEQARGITMKSSAIALLHIDEPARELRTSAASSSSSTTSASPTTTIPYLINLIDSPGHVDFSVDVATAARLCDGALVVVDAVEGVCIQTHAVLRTAWGEGVRPALVLNKVDRLITELRLTPLEAYSHLCRILEQVNVIMSSLYTSDLMLKLGRSNSALTATNDAAAVRSAAAAASDAAAAAAAANGAEEERELVLGTSTTATGTSTSTSTDTGAAGAGAGADSSSSSSSSSSTTTTTIATDGWAIDIDEQAEAKLFFDPALGNVVFASAFDGWAFSVDDFAKLHSERLGVSRALLRRGMWGDNYYKSKTKRIVTGSAAAAAAKGRNLAVSLMLEPLWAVYDCIILNPNDDRVTKIITSLKLESSIPKRDLASKEPRVKLSAIMRAWMPLSNAVLGMVVRATPSPKEAQRKRLEKLWPLLLADLAPQQQLLNTATASTSTAVGPLVLTKEDMTLAERLQRVRACIEACDTSEEAETVVFVSKMFAVPKESLPDQSAAYSPFVGGPGSATAAAAAAHAAASGHNVLVAAAAALLLPLPDGGNTASTSTQFPQTLLPAGTQEWLGMDAEIVGGSGNSSPSGNKMNLAPVTNPTKRLSASGMSGGVSIDMNDNNNNSNGSSSSSSSSAEESSKDPNSVETFIAFARVFSGVLTPNKPVFVLGPKYDPRTPDADGCAHISRISRPLPLYVMMGRDLAPVRAAYAGGVVGIGRLGAHILKTATLCSTPCTPSLAPMVFQTTPLVRVAIEPTKPTDLPAVERGLALLNQADPCVEVAASESGELTLAALGELHLQRCIKDLEQRFARVELRVSAPILSFLETVTGNPPCTSTPTPAFPAPSTVSAAIAAAASNSNDAGSEQVGGDDNIGSSFAAGADGAGGGGAGGGRGSDSASIASSAIGENNSSSSSSSSQLQPHASIQTANPNGGGLPFPFSWTVPEAGVAYHPPTANVYSSTSDKNVSLRMRAIPLPESITLFLQANVVELRGLVQEADAKRMENARAAAHSTVSATADDGSSSSSSLSSASSSATTTTATSSALTRFSSQLRSLFEEAGGEWVGDFDRIASFGPKRVGPNVLICRATASTGGAANSSRSSSSSGPGSKGASSSSSTFISNTHGIEESLLGSVWQTLGLQKSSSTSTSLAAAHSASKGNEDSSSTTTSTTEYQLSSSTLATLRSAIPQGFQLATSSGPLCAEPLWGVAYILEEVTFRQHQQQQQLLATAASASAIDAGSQNGLPIPSTPSISTGQLISATRDACRVSVEASGPRLVEAHYRCELQCSGGRGGGGEALGKCYGVLSKRRGRIVAEDVFEGTETFVITALLPVVESFGFADDLRKKTSGAATSPQLLFDHWEVLPIDPFFVPSSREDKEAMGATLHAGQMKNLARVYLDTVRSRKGLIVERKLVVHADKQRNLSRKK